MPGPFHRLESPSQTKNDAIAQQQSIELWGAAGRNNAQSNLPSVKAHRSSLPGGQRGIEFDTPVAPTPNTGSSLVSRKPRCSITHRCEWNGLRGYSVIEIR